jgi:hypothetical protein
MADELMIPALFVCVLPDGPLEFGCGSWLTSRKSTRSLEVLQTPQIVESHGGQLWASANSGRDATFHFTLPTEVP